MTTLKQKKETESLIIELRRELAKTSLSEADRDLAENVMLSYFQDDKAYYAGTARKWLRENMNELEIIINHLLENQSPPPPAQPVPYVAAPLQHPTLNP